MSRCALLSVVFLIFLSPTLRSAVPNDADNKLVLDLLVLATDATQSSGNRLAAIDTIGKLGPNAALAIPALRRLLGASPAASPDALAFRLHLVRALGKIGPAAREVLPELVRARGSDPVLDKAIDDALAVIAAPFSPPAISTRDLIAAWLHDLSGPDLLRSLTAAKSLSAPLPQGANDDDYGDALQGLWKAVEVSADPDVRRLATESAMKVLVAAKARNAPKAGQWQKEAAVALAGLLQRWAGATMFTRLFKMAAVGEAGERIMTARFLGTLGQAARDQLTTLQTVALLDSDLDALCSVKNAIAAINRP